MYMCIYIYIYIYIYIRHRASARLGDLVVPVVDVMLVGFKFFFATFFQTLKINTDTKGKSNICHICIS